MAAPFLCPRFSSTQGSGTSRRGAARRRSGSGSGAAHAPGRGARRWASRRGEIGPQGRRRWDHGPETRGAGSLRGGVLLRQSADKIPALLLQHALLGESWGSPGHLGCRAPLESEVGCPRLRRGRPGIPGSRRAWQIAMPSFLGCWHFGVIYPGEGHHSGTMSRWGVEGGGSGLKGFSKDLWIFSDEGLCQAEKVGMNGTRALSCWPTADPLVHL